MAELFSIPIRQGGGAHFPNVLLNQRQRVECIHIDRPVFVPEGTRMNSGPKNTVWNNPPDLLLRRYHLQPKDKSENEKPWNAFFKPLYE